MNVQHALNAFYDRHNYGREGGIDRQWDWIRFGPIAVPIFNPEVRRKNIYLHDIGHVMMDYDTTWRGEGSISSWEIATGGWGRLYFGWVLALWAMAVGVMLYPRTSYQAFQAGLHMNNALTGGLSKETMYALTLDELREQLRRDRPAQRSYWLWAGLSLLLWFSPFIVGIIACTFLFY